jgi:hypothetical protein
MEEVIEQIKMFDFQGLTDWFWQGLSVGLRSHFRPSGQVPTVHLLDLAGYPTGTD